MPAEVDSMMYYGQKPWHGLGIKVDHALTAAEALVAASLDWEVGLTTIYHRVGDTYKEVLERRGIMRLDSEDVLGVVGTKYTPLQNKNAFNFFDAVVGNEQGKYVTAGSLKGGRRIWILAKVGETFHIAGNDDIDRFVLLCNSHDGTSQVRMLITPVRVVCNNTLSMALSRATEGVDMVKLRHTSGISKAASDVRDVLGIVNDYYEIFTEQANAMAAYALNEVAFQNYMDEIGFQVRENIRDENDEKENARIIRVRGTLTKLFDEGLGMKTNHGSLWNAYNAVTEYIDHNRLSRKTQGYDSAQEAKLDSLWFGEGARIKRNAWEKATSLVA